MSNISSIPHHLVCKQWYCLECSVVFQWQPSAKYFKYPACRRVRNSTLCSCIFDTSWPNMADSPRRHISTPIKGDPWRYQTVQGHVAHPPRQQHMSVPIQSDRRTSQTVQGRVDHPPTQHMSVPIQGNRWLSQTVQGHVAHPPRQQHDGWISQTVQGHISHPPRQQHPSVPTQITPRPPRASARSALDPIHPSQALRPHPA